MTQRCMAGSGRMRRSTCHEGRPQGAIPELQKCLKDAFQGAEEAAGVALGLRDTMS